LIEQNVSSPTVQNLKFSGKSEFDNSLWRSGSCLWELPFFLSIKNKDKIGLISSLLYSIMIIQQRIGTRHDRIVLAAEALFRLEKFLIAGLGSVDVAAECRNAAAFDPWCAMP